MSKKLIYLAHPALSKRKVRRWQLDMEKSNPNLKFINPFFNGPKEKIEIEHRHINQKVPVMTLHEAEVLVDYDIACVQETDFTLAVVDGETSYGTIMEICYAHNYGKDVYIICTNNYEKHPWIQYHSKKVFKSFEEAEQWLTKDY